MNISHLGKTLSAGGMVTVLATGCLGPRVLSENVTHSPALDPKVELRLKTNAPTDVLVIYDDKASSNDTITRRAFYLYANQQRIEHGRRPAYVKLAEVDHLAEIPVLKEIPENPTSITNELYAVEMTSRRFQLESHGRVVTEFELPQYENWFTAKKLFLFPAAVGADAVGASAVAAVVAAYSLCESGTTIKVH